MVRTYLPTSIEKNIKDEHIEHELRLALALYKVGLHASAITQVVAKWIVRDYKRMKGITN